MNLALKASTCEARPTDATDASAWLWAYATWRSRAVAVPTAGPCFVPILSDFVNDVDAAQAVLVAEDVDPPGFVELDAIADEAVVYAKRAYAPRQEIAEHRHGEAESPTSEDVFFFGGYLHGGGADAACAPVRLAASTDRERMTVRARGQPADRTWCLPGATADLARRNLRAVADYASTLAAAAAPAPAPPIDTVGGDVPGVHTPCSSPSSCAPNARKHGAAARDILLAALDAPFGNASAPRADAAPSASAPGLTRASN